MSNQQDRNKKINRRKFVNYTGTFLALGMVGLTSNAKDFSSNSSTIKRLSKIRIKSVDSNFEREPLTPYHFKGSFVTELWQTIARLESESGISKIGLGTQSVLWSDSKVFAEHSESGGNALMYALSERALQLMKGNSFTNPLELLDELLPEAFAPVKRELLPRGFILNTLL